MEIERRFIMKAMNNTIINSIMNNLVNRAIMAKKVYLKYICLFLLLLGSGTHAWGNTTVTLSSFGDDTECTGTWCDGGSFTDNGSNTWTAGGYIVSSDRLAIGKGGANFLQTPDFGDNEIKSITVTWYGNTDFYLALQTTDGTELEAIKNPINDSSNPATRTFTVSSGYAQLKLVGRRESGTSNARSTISSVVLVYGPPCDKNVTISAGTATNCTFELSNSGSQPSCDGVATTVTVSPSTGYGTPVVSQSGASAAPTITGSGNEWTVTYAANTTSTSTIAVSCSANNYTITLNNQSATTAGTASITATYNANTNLSGTPAITVPAKTGYTFGGYYTATGGSGAQIIDASGNVNASAGGGSTYTDASKNWKYADDIELYAKWTPKNYKLTVGEPSHVAIKATPSGKSDITEGNSDDAVPCDANITLNAVLDVGYTQAGWKITKDADESDVTVDYLIDATTMSMPPFDATVTAAMYDDFVFSCAELTLTAHPETAGAPIFITSTAEKEVRSQGYITITGSGLTPSTDLTFPGLGGKFEVLTSTGGTISTDASGAINVDAYIFYTPGAGDTEDGLDKMAGLTVSVSGAKPKQVSISQNIIGRHLPTTGYVIAGKKDNKWYALPSNMASTSTPDPSEIAVDDINNPTIAYTAPSNIFGLEGPTTSGGGNNIASGYGQYVRLTMSIESSSGSGKPAPLFGTSGSEDASSSPKIGKSGTAIATNNLSEGWWWKLTQTNTSITNPQDAKYTIKCANNSNTLSIKNSPFVWGLYASGVEELRLIPASDIPFTEAYFVEWGQHGGVIEVDAEGIDANSVTATLNGTTRGAISFAQTLTNGKSRATIYNYTVNFGDAIDFAAAASNGALLTLKWTKNAVVKAVTSIVVPKIIAASSTLNSHGATDGDWSSAEVHVLPGVTLTANAGDFTSNDVMIKHLEIYPGATVVVTKGLQASGTLKVKTLVLRNGWTRAGEKAYDVARLYITPTTASLAKNAPSEDVWYTDWYIDYDQYYPIAIPFPVATNRITYKNTKSAATGGVTIRYYDGARRAEHEQQDQADNWVAYTWGGTMPENLAPSTGYAMTARRPSGKAFSIVRMPMTFSNPWTALGEHGYVGETHKDQVTVTGYGKDTAPWYAMGWNFIGNPYMCTFNGNDGGISGKIELQNGGSVKYATIPDLEFKNYYQVPIAEANLKPASGFFIQANNADPQTITFNASKIVPPSAPVRYTVQQERIPEQEAYIRLSNGEEKDLMGLIIGEDYTEAYEPNADLAKVLGGANAVKTYMHYADMDMAYVAINETLAKEWIPVTVNIPADGEYTYSLTSYSEVNDLEGVYLIDYMNSNLVTNLIENDYTFVAEAGTSTDRFAINAIVGKRNTPTDIDIINAGGDINSSKPLKFLWNDKVFILHNGMLYDSTGKKVKEINK